MELGTHLAASPCGGIVHLSGDVWTQPGEWAPAFTSWRLTIWPGEGDEEAFEIVRGQTGIVNHGKQVVQLLQMLTLFPQMPSSRAAGYLLGVDVALCMDPLMFDTVRAPSETDRKGSRITFKVGANSTSSSKHERDPSSK